MFSRTHSFNYTSKFQPYIYFTGFVYLYFKNVASSHLQLKLRTNGKNPSDITRML